MSLTSAESRKSGKLMATYSDATTSESQHTFSHDLPCPSADAKAKAEYLSNLRKSARSLQDEVNAFLTKKMEEDKAIAASSGTEKKKAKDEEEEENYGEEKGEED